MHYIYMELMEVSVFTVANQKLNFLIPLKKVIL